MRVYLDSSALLKRLFAEPESPALSAALAEYVRSDAALITSSLGWLEVSRAVRRYASGEASMLIEVDGLVEAALSGVLEKPVTAEVIALARRLPPPVLRSFDAVHLASALLLDADVVVAYDQRLVGALAEHGLTALSPT